METRGNNFFKAKAKKSQDHFHRTHSSEFWPHAEPKKHEKHHHYHHSSAKKILHSAEKLAEEATELLHEAKQLSNKATSDKGSKNIHIVHKAPSSWRRDGSQEKVPKNGSQTRY
jgi:hypothetical protein